MGIFTWYWSLLDVPLNFIVTQANISAPPLAALAYKLIVTFLLLVIVTRTIKGTVRKVKLIARGGRSDSLLEPDEIAAFASRPGSPLEGVQDIHLTIASLKQTKNYDRLGEIYASMNKFKEAARWYKKGRNLKMAAAMLARGGKPLKAAKIMMKQGDFHAAGQFFAQAERFLDSAKAYQQGGKPGMAAAAFAKAGKVNEALEAYLEYFANPRDAQDEQLHIADDCFDFMQRKLDKATIPAETRRKLACAIAARFEQAKRLDVAAKLFIDGGDLARAGQVFLTAGNLEMAAKCMKQAGHEKEASQISGRFYEQRQQFREAALAYAAAGEYLKAGDCYARANDPVASGECYEKAADFYRAGVAYMHAANYTDAIRVFQKIKETDKNFDLSRPLLGRAFYELHEYEHCAAALDNFLMGKRVETANKEYFYMLSLAYEQLGKLDRSREILLKIRTVDTGFRDVTQRISNISSRISMQSGLAADASHVATRVTPVYHGAPEAATADARAVEDRLEGRYIIERELGRGGMGVVYLARDRDLDRRVALKFIGNLIDGSEEFKQRFIREAKAAAKINHPNIIHIYDISASAGKAYIAMEYVEGTSLARYIEQKGKLSPREAVNIIGQALNALAAIHEAGIVHRDIKPDNILLGKGGLVKVMDFGLAKSADNRLTRTGTSMGTPSYMSPEQVLGKDADARSDIYSIGLMLHEMLTGKTVFCEGDVLERQLMEMPKPPSAFTEGIPPKLDEVIMKCVQKKPEDRYENSRALLADLRAAKGE